MTASVALCTYNGAKYVMGLLDSIMAQSIKPDELIIIDDVSTDATWSILESYLFPINVSVALSRNSDTLGVNANYALAISQCSSDIILIADQDDLWHRDRIAEQKRLLASSACDIIFTNARLINEHGDLTGDLLLPKLSYKSRPGQEQFALLQHTLKENIVTGSTLAMKREVVEYVLPFPSTETLLYDEWIALLCMASDKINILPIDQTLIDYRIHDHQYTARFSHSPEPMRPYNYALHKQWIDQRHAAIKVAFTRSDAFDTPSREVMRKAYSFWDKRQANTSSPTFTRKLSLCGDYLRGNYSSFSKRRPTNEFLKDLLWVKRIEIKQLGA